jgi:hypothetical protein
VVRSLKTLTLDEAIHAERVKAQRAEARRQAKAIVEAEMEATANATIQNERNLRAALNAAYSASGKRMPAVGPDGEIAIDVSVIAIALVMGELNSFNTDKLLRVYNADTTPAEREEHNAAAREAVERLEREAEARLNAALAPKKSLLARLFWGA